MSSIFNWIANSQQVDNDGINLTVAFNGLNNFPKDEYSCFGPAPPSLNDLLSKFGKEYTILSSDKAIESEKNFYYLLETQGPPETWLGTKKNYNNTLL